MSEVAMAAEAGDQVICGSACYTSVIPRLRAWKSPADARPLFRFNFRKQTSATAGLDVRARHLGNVEQEQSSLSWAVSDA